MPSPDRQDGDDYAALAYQLWRRVTKAAAIIGLTNAILACVIAFGITVTQAQQAGITGLVNAVLVCGFALWDPKIPWGRVGIGDSK